MNAVVSKLPHRAAALPFLLLLVNYPRASQAEVIYRHEVDGFTFTSVKKFYEGKLINPTDDSKHLFNNMIKDEYIKEHILLTYGDAIYTMNLNTKEVHHIAGKASTSGYVEGRGTAAEFNTITGLLTSPVDYPNNIWIVDSLNYCIRSLSRLTNTTSQFAGRCTQNGDTNTKNDAESSKFQQIISMAKNPKNGFYCVVIDQSSYAAQVKSLTLQASETKWKVYDLITYRGETMKSLVFHPQGNLFYIVKENGVSFYNITTRINGARLTSTTRGHNDGKLINAKVDGLSHIVLLNNDVFVLADTENYRLRVVDLKNKTISSICGINPNLRKYEKVFISGSLTKCRLKRTTYIMQHPTRSKLFLNGEDIYELCLTDQDTCDWKPVEEQQYVTKKPADPVVVSTSTVAAVIMAALVIIGVIIYKRRQARANIPAPTDGSMAAPDSLISVLRANSSKTEVPQTSGSRTSVLQAIASVLKADTQPKPVASVLQGKSLGPGQAPFARRVSATSIGSRLQEEQTAKLDGSNSLGKVSSAKSSHIADFSQSDIISSSSKIDKNEKKLPSSNKLIKNMSKSSAK